MKKLRIIFQSNYLYYILILSASFYVFLFNFFIDIESKYNFNETIIKGNIIEKNIDGDKLSLTIKGKEKIIVNYYFNSLNEKQKFDLKYGDYIKCIGTLNKPKDNTNFNTFNYKKYLESKNIYYTFNAKKISLIKNNTNIIYELKNNIEFQINRSSKTKEYLKAFILGNKKDIDYLYKEKYQNLGISHIFAISGMHISLITCILLFILKNFKFKYAFINIFLIIYIILTGFSASIIRSSLIFILFSICKTLKLKIKTINLLMLIFSIMLFINPKYIYDLGFKFSFIISFFLLKFKSNIDLRKNYIKKTLYISYLSFFISLPLVINNFYQVNLLSIIFNLFYVPFISFIVFPLGLITFFLPCIDSIYYYFILLLENFTNFVSNINSIVFFAKMPLLFVILYYLFIYYYFKNEKIIKKLYLFVIILLFYNYNRVVSPEIIFIDVGQGDSALLRIFDKNILIDTGGKISFNDKKWKKRNSSNSICHNTLLPVLKSSGVKKLDYLILSHGDNDHLGETKELFQNIDVDNIIINNYEENEKEKELIENRRYFKLGDEDILNIYNYKLRFLNPTKDKKDENLNSLIVYTKINNFNILLMGDAGEENEKEIINKYNLNNMDIIKLGHHGSNTSSSYEFLKETKPKYVVISVGENNIYNHPSKEVIERLNKLNIKKYRTDINGSIKFKLKDNLIIKTATQ